MPADGNIIKDLTQWDDAWKSHSDMYDCCIKVSNFLSLGVENQQLRSQLTLLDQLLKNQVGEKSRMGNILRSSEAAWGVNIFEGSSVQVTALRSLSPDEFGFSLTEADLIKDPGAGTDHGEYTHRIQWFTIMGAKIISEANANKLLRMMGDKNLLALKEESGKQHANGLWDCLFDRLRWSNSFKHFLATSENDFRSPEHFNLWITAQQDVYPNLASYLNARSIKRDAESITTVEFIKSKLVPVNNRIGEFKDNPEIKACR